MIQADNAYWNTFSSIGSYDSIHWVGYCQVGKALDKDFGVKGISGVYVACSASHNITYPYNNWGMNTQMGHYVAHHILGLTNPNSLKDTSQATFINSNLGKTFADGHIKLVAIVPETNDMHYHFIKDGKPTPVLKSKLVNIRGNKLSYRIVGDIEYGDINMSTFFGAEAADLEVGVRESLLELELVNNDLKVIKFEIHISSYDSENQFKDFTSSNTYLNSGLNKVV